MFQVKKQPKYYGIYSLSQSITKNGLMLLFVVFFDMKWDGMILGYIIGYFLFFLISIFLFNKTRLFTKSINKEFIIDNIKVGFPLSLHLASGWLSSSATRIIVSSLLGTAATGSFGIGATIGMVVLFIQDSFNKAFIPFLFEKLNNFNIEIEKQLIRLTYIYNISLLLFSLIIGVFGYFFLETIFGVAYSEGKVVVLFIALAHAFNGMYKMHVNYIFFVKKTHLIFIISTTTGSLNIILSYLFINSWGLIGAAISLCVINIVGYLLAWYIGNRVYPMNWFRLRYILQ